MRVLRRRCLHLRLPEHAERSSRRMPLWRGLRLRSRLHLPQVTDSPDRPGCASAAAGTDTLKSRKSHMPTHRIGRIVIGSLVTGHAAALALTVGPVAGAQEHVITGVSAMTSEPQAASPGSSHGGA